jgi:NAD(P)H-dependent flavin oxidoreductase YrpB (nitropropane dioxygenase family)
MRTKICDLFGIDLPIFAFSHCRDVVAAVSRAGGFGVLGALAFTPEQLELELRWIDEHVDGKPYGVDVVMPAKYEGSTQADIGKADFEKMIPEGHKAFVKQLLERYEIPPLPEGEQQESLLGWTHAGGQRHVDVSLAHPIKLLVNALGPPPPDVIEKAHEKGVKVAALVGTVAQARKQVEAGVDIIVAQGTEAGGHTGEIGTMVLVPEVVDAVSPIPVLAAGGIGCGRQVAAALCLGAEGVWTGSIWLAVKESDYAPALKDKMFAASSSDTVRSRALSGKPARQLKTAWTAAWDGKDSPGTLPMPLQFMLTSEAVARIFRSALITTSPKAREVLGTAVGQIVGRIKDSRSTKDVIYSMTEEVIETMERMNALMAAAEK